MTEPAGPPPRGDEDRPPSGELAVVAALVVAGVVLRFVTTSPLWLDEALSVNLAGLPVGELPDALRRDGHPPLYYLLLGGWMDVVGDGDVAVRALSGVVAVATVPVVWWWARHRVGPVAAAWAAALLAVVPYATRYGTEARMYALVMLLAALGAVALTRLLERPGPAPAAGVAVAGAALLYTHYWSLWLLAATGVWLCWTAWRAEHPGTRRGARWGVGALVVAGVAFVPWLPVLLDQLRRTGTPWSDPFRPSAALATSLVDLTGGRLAAEAVLGAAGVAVLLVLGLTGRALGPGRVDLDLRTRPAVRPELVVGGGALVLGGTVAWITGGGFASRYAAVAVPALVVAAGAGAAVLTGATRRTVLVGGLATLLLGISVIGAVDQRTQAEAAADAVAAAAGPDDLVVVCPDQLGPALRRYLPATLDVVRYPDLGDPRFVDWRDYAERNDAADPADVAAAVRDRAGGATTWLVWTGGYRTLEGDCERLAAALGADRPTEVVLAGDGEEYFEPMTVHRYPAP